MSSSSSSASLRRRAIGVIMSRAAAYPSPRSVKAAAQLAATGREARAEYQRRVLPAMEDGSFWEELIDRVMAHGQRMAAVEVVPEIELDPATGRIQLLPGVMDIRLRASTPALTDGFVVTATWADAGGPELFLEHPMVQMVSPIPAAELVSWLYRNPGFLGQDASWRGEFLVNLMAGLIHGLARGDWLRRKVVITGPMALFPRTTAAYLGLSAPVFPADEEEDDEDAAADAALMGARALLAQEAAAQVQDVPEAYLRAYQALFGAALRAHYR